MGRSVSKSFYSDSEAQAWAVVAERSLKGGAEIPVRGKRVSKEEIIAKATSAEPVSGVYFLLLDNEVVYVGSTRHLRRRIIQHQNDGRVFDSYTFLECSEAEMLNLEVFYIQEFVPEQNKNHRKNGRVRVPNLLPKEKTT